MNKTIEQLIQEYKELLDAVPTAKIKELKEEKKAIDGLIKIESNKTAIDAKKQQIINVLGDDVFENDIVKISPRKGNLIKAKSGWNLQALKQDMPDLYDQLVSMGLINEVPVDAGAGSTLAEMAKKNTDLEKYYTEVRGADTANFKWL